MTLTPRWYHIPSNTRYLYVSIGDTSNGEHWGTATPHHGNSSQASYSVFAQGAGGAGGAVAAQSLTFGCAGGGAGGGSSYTDSPRKRESCIRTGEITGYRIWKVKKGRLRSLVMDYVWTPKAVNEIECSAPILWCYGHGFHAFRSLELAEREMASCEEHYLYCDLVIGEIEMWGEVMEHALGYRSRFAKVTKLHRMALSPRSFISRLFRPRPLKRLRKIYGVD